MLSATGVEFRYERWQRRTEVFAGLDWRVSAGATTLLLGPNGAGKSTLLKLLSGFERPQGGTIALGSETSRRALYARVGWMPQDVQPARGLTVEEQVDYAGWLSGLRRRQRRSRVRSALASVDLLDLRDKRANELSGGQLRRLGLAQTLVRETEVLLLDEPTAGLDPAQALNFRDIMSRLEIPGGIVISTHQVDDLVAHGDRVSVLTDGRFAFNGTVSEFKALGHHGQSLAHVFAEMIGGGGH